MEICKDWEHVVFFLFVVFLLVPPSIADEPTDFLVTTHAPTVITCTASGVPFPSIHWAKNGIRLLPRGEGYRILSSGKTQLSDYTAIDWIRFYWMALLGLLLHQNKRIKYICIPGLRHLGKNALKSGEGELGKGIEKKSKNRITNNI